MYSELVQHILDRLLSKTVRSEDLKSSLDALLQELVTGLSIDCGLICLIDGSTGDLVVTSEHAEGGGNLLNRRIDPEQSTLLVLEFLSRPANYSDMILIESPNPEGEILDSIHALGGEHSSTLAVLLKARDIVSGMLFLRAKKQHKWSDIDRLTVAKLSQVIAIFLSYEFDLARPPM